MEVESERTKILMEQYKLLEERRKTFGNQFMQVIGFSIALFTLLVGFLGGKNVVFFPVVLRVSGIVFMIIAFLGYRLGKRQDDCEKKMVEIETVLSEILHSPVISLPHGAKTFGARKLIVTTLIIGGLLLIVFSFK